MSKYKNMETGEIMTLEEVREYFYSIAKDNPDIYDCMNFNEFLNDAIGNGSFRMLTTRYLVVCCSRKYNGDIYWGFYDTIDAVTESICKDGIRYVGILNDVMYYANGDNSKIYGVYETGIEPYIVVCSSVTSTIDFEICNFDIESDAYIFMLCKASSLLNEDYDDARGVWFGNEWNTGAIKINIGNNLYRWNLIHNYT